MATNYGIADRMINAVDNFVETIQSISGCNKAEAEKVLAVYRKNKIVKLDAVIGRYSVKHGVFLDKEVIKNAIDS